jgi:hypothetical protein
VATSPSNGFPHGRKIGLVTHLELSRPKHNTDRGGVPVYGHQNATAVRAKWLVELSGKADVLHVQAQRWRDDRTNNIFVHQVVERLVVGEH